MRDVNREFEQAIRRDPANWFWVHRRWKPPEPKTRPPVETDESIIAPQP
jgi:lauroyl/myristoyl acyltransferase